MSGDICTCGWKFRTAEDFRDHMPCDGTKAEQEIDKLEREIAALKIENASLKAELQHYIDDDFKRQLCDECGTRHTGGTCLGS